MCVCVCALSPLEQVELVPGMIITTNIIIITITITINVVVVVYVVNNMLHDYIALAIVSYLLFVCYLLFIIYPHQFDDLHVVQTITSTILTTVCCFMLLRF